MDYYEVLLVTDAASQEEIKRSYQQLLLKYHPDKSVNQKADKFVLINKAYEILKDPSSRKEYDSRRFQESTRCQMIIHDTVARTDFSYDEANKVHYYICKCGGWYIMEEAADENEYIICCDECSLVIKVINNKRKPVDW